MHAQGETITISTTSLSITEGDSGTKNVPISIKLNDAPGGTNVDFRVEYQSGSTATDNTNKAATSCSAPAPAGADFCYGGPHAASKPNEYDLTSIGWGDRQGPVGSKIYVKVYNLKIIGDTDDEGDETIKVRVRGDDLDFGWHNIASNTLTITITNDDGTDPPAKPTGLTATAGNAQVMLSWTDPNDDSISKWQVRYTTRISGWTGSSWGDIPGSDADTTSYTVTGLTNDSPYRFQVRAVNSGGNGASSNAVTATPAAPVVLTKPANFAAAPGNGQVVLTWDDPQNAAITVWELRQKKGSDSWSDWTAIPGSTATTTTYTVPNLDNGSTYRFQLRAKAVSVTGPHAQATAVLLTAPANFAATPGNGQVVLTWDDPQNAAITVWELRQKKGSDSWSDWTAIPGSTATTTTYTVPNLDNGSTYRFQLRAKAVRVTGPPSSEATAMLVVPTAAGVTISTAALTVAEGSSGTYTVKLDKMPTNDVTVTVAGMSGDVTVSGSPLTFTTTNWAMAQTVTVSAATDTDTTTDPDVTLTHSASGGGYGAVTIASVVVSITETVPPLNDAPMDESAATPANEVHSAVLPQIAGAVMSQTLNTVLDRVTGVAGGVPGGDGVPFQAMPRPSELERSGGSRSPMVVLSGRQAAELLDGTTFNLQAEGVGGSGTPALWAQGDWTSLKGSDGELHWDGELRSLHLGGDLRVRDDVLVGAAVSRTVGDLDAENGGVQSTYETALTAVQPYVAWMAADGAHLWGSIGYGEGEVRLREAAMLRQTDMTWRSAAVGGRYVLRENARMVDGGTTRLAVKGWGSTARLRTVENDGLVALTLNTTRVRVMLEGSHEQSLGDDRSLTASLEAGVRYDDGDLGRGAGLEVGGGVRWRNAVRRLTSELRVRTLVDHEQAREEWGASLLLRHESQADGSGMAMSLGLSRGQAASDLDWRLASGRSADAALDASAVHLEAEVSHGLRLPGAGALLSPYAGLRVPESGSGMIRLGTRYRLRDEFSLGLAMESRPGEVAVDGISLQGALYW